MAIQLNPTTTNTTSQTINKTLDDNVKNSNTPNGSSPLSSLLKGMKQSLSLLSRNLTFNAESKNSNPLSTMQQAPITSAPLYKKFTLEANKGNTVQLESMHRDAKLANFAYTRDLKDLPEGYEVDDAVAVKAASEMGIERKNIENYRGAVVDSKSGLTAVIVINKIDKEIVVIFGGTTSGKKVGENLMKRSRPGMNFMTTLSQWGANFRAGLGIEPKSYGQAAELLASVQRQTAGKCTVRAVGHSKGGGEAMYASMKQATPVKVSAFCPAHLSNGLINKIPEENRELATNLIDSYSPYGDPVSALRGKLPDTPGIGNGYHFNGIPGRNPIDIHDQFMDHVEHFCSDLTPDSYA